MEQKELKDQLRKAIDKGNRDAKSIATATQKKANEVIEQYRAQAQTQGEGLLLIQVILIIVYRNNIEEYKRCI